MFRRELINKIANTAREKLHMKLASNLQTELLPHQQRVVDRLFNTENKGLLVYHGLGSGKTLSSIAAADKLGLPTTAIAPASLRNNYKKELSKHLKDEGTNFSTISYNKAVADPASIGSGLVVIDEAHNLGQASSQRSKLLGKLNSAEKLLLLTGTPVRNDPSEIAPLINALRGEAVLPVNKKDFYAKYVAEKHIDPGLFRRLMGVRPGTEYELKNTSELKRLLRGLVDYHPSSSEDFPEVHESIVKVPMTRKQQEVYDFVTDQIPYSLRYKMQKNLPPSKTESRSLNAFLNAARQVANNPAAYDGGGLGIVPDDSAKIITAVSNLEKHLSENDLGKGLVYSNYLGSGINPYAEQLEARGIPYGILTGNIPFETRSQLVSDFNNDKLKALLISSAGAEGLDLKGTSLVQLLEPHWNEEKLQQVMGRGIRYGSHSHLPEEKRKVLVERYLAKQRPTLLNRLLGTSPGTSVDEYLSTMSDRKNRLNAQLLDILKES